MLSSLQNDASGIVSVSASANPSASPSAGASSGVQTSAATGAAPRATGAVGMEVMFGAAGVLGAAVFGF